MAEAPPQNVCFNCGKSSHLSRFCPEPAKFTRCPICDNVCFNENSHKRYCSNTGFLSAPIEQVDNVAEITPFMDIYFNPIVKLTIKSKKDDTDGKYFWCTSANMMVSQYDAHVVFHSSTTKMRSIAIVDHRNQLRMKIVASHYLKINDHYSISSNGLIQYNRFNEQKVDDSVDCVLKVVLNAEVVYARIGWAGKYYIFDIYPDGVIYRDPIVINCKYPPQKENQPNAEENEQCIKVKVANESDELPANPNVGESSEAKMSPEANKPSEIDE